VAASLAHEVLSLPMGPYLDRPSAHRVVQALAQGLAQLRDERVAEQAGDKAA
jgi:UDP-2-acetamido-2-deoxy-ribo-hexuluronate aminotransferase